MAERSVVTKGRRWRVKGHFSFSRIILGLPIHPRFTRSSIILSNVGTFFFSLNLRGDVSFFPPSLLFLSRTFCCALWKPAHRKETLESQQICARTNDKGKKKKKRVGGETKFRKQTKTRKQTPSRSFLEGLGLFVRVSFSFFVLAASVYWTFFSRPFFVEDFYVSVSIWQSKMLPPRIPA